MGATTPGVRRQQMRCWDGLNGGMLYRIFAARTKAHVPNASRVADTSP
jgi:hypothetical protein